MKTKEDYINEMNEDCPNDITNLFIYPGMLAFLAIIISALIKESLESVDILTGVLRLFLVIYFIHFARRLKYKYKISKLEMSKVEIKTQDISK
jgi:hypothetical protein